MRGTGEGVADRSPAAQRWLALGAVASAVLAVDQFTKEAVRTSFQGRGIATAAMRLVLDQMRVDGSRRFVHATVTTDNAASSAVCRKLGFELVGPIDYEYPPGNPVHGYDWRLDLTK